ncbi:MAG: DUF4352 domain-containing protein [bacterium]
MLNKKISLSILVATVTVGILSFSRYVDYRVKQSSSDSIASSVINPVNNVLGEQISKSNDYSVTVDNYKKIDNGNTVAFTVTVANTSDHVVQLSPYMQFKLVSSDTNTLSLPAIQKGAPLFGGGPLSVGQKVSGNIYYEVSENEQSSLGFYNNDDSNSYIKLVTIKSKMQENQTNLKTNKSSKSDD